METLLAYFWIWIPIVGILAGSFSEWLKFKEKMAKLGNSTGELEKAFEELQTENATLVRRLQNLEAIVTHEVWEASQNERDPATAAARIDAALIEEEPTDAERAARLAQRLR